MNFRRVTIKEVDYRLDNMQAGDYIAGKSGARNGRAFLVVIRSEKGNSKWMAIHQNLEMHKNFIEVHYGLEGRNIEASATELSDKEIQEMLVAFNATSIEQLVTTALLDKLGL